MPGDQERIAALTQGAIDVISPGELTAKLASGKRLRVKLGLDPTASDLHIGHAVVLRTLRRFQDAGHLAVLILGDFTARVGDPSGRSATRPRLSREQIDAAADTYLAQLTRILDPDPARLEVRRNSEWLDRMEVEDILRLTARTTVARMLERDDFAKRYSSGEAISLTEFLYPLFQGWDSVMVDADVELGGTDQLFNLLVGRQLQQQEGREPQVVITTPLLEGLSGGPKMSKSLGNFVGLTEPPAEQFGKLMSIPDALIPTYLEYATAWPQARIDETIAELASGARSPRDAKRLLGRTVADLYHGPGTGEQAQADFDRVFIEGKAPTEIAGYELADDGEVRLSRVLHESGLVGSKREAARMIRDGAVRVDAGAVAEDVVKPASAWWGTQIQVGKRKWIRIMAPTV
ncbi:MAG TPA: tyrosine--tRNA ligase [Acidimicrobiia bacterium]|jgi:tyrosyl-tRNA synthetase|nr:tyrosine--tRNA ligase [Acidimicrobiia bacterium]